MEAGYYHPGQQLPGSVYRVVKHLATGGMGSVYDVEDVTVGKRYVVKTLHPSLVSRHDLARRMEAEARTLAKLQHPNIVDVVTAGVTTDEQRMPFYVMERLNGQNLRVVLDKKGSLELSHCYRIAIDVLDALEHAHENSVIHRDVKPENIFLHRNTNGTTTTKLLDFGIMRLLDRKSSHTQGKFIGTLRYASPEQIMGEALGPGTDIYSLGVVLYEMVCGRGPFDDAGGPYAIGAAHAQLPPPPVSRFVRVPAALEQLVMSALGKNPNERPRDCFTFAAELRRLLREEEAAPKAVTAVNVLSAVPETHPAQREPGPPDPLAGTAVSPGGSAAPPIRARASATPQGPAVHDVRATKTGLGPGPQTRGAQVARGERGEMGPTEDGMPLPSCAGDTLVDAGSAAFAPTMRSTPPSVSDGTAGGLVLPGLGRRDAQADARVDRNAETRDAAPFACGPRVAAPNGTAIDDAPVDDDVLREALGERAPLIVPPLNDAPGAGEIVFARSLSSGTGGTGPLAGEARTRPPERFGHRSLVFAASLAGLMTIVAGVTLFRSWEANRAGPTPGASVVVTSAASVPSGESLPAPRPPSVAASVASLGPSPAAVSSAPAGPTAAASASSDSRIMERPRPLEARSGPTTGLGAKGSSESQVPQGGSGGSATHTSTGAPPSTQRPPLSSGARPKADTATKPAVSGSVRPDQINYE